jgi:hypothetical protein
VVLKKVYMVRFFGLTGSQSEGVYNKEISVGEHGTEVQKQSN